MQEVSSSASWLLTIDAVAYIILLILHQKLQKHNMPHKSSLNTTDLAHKG